MEKQIEKTITVISNANFVLFKGLSQKDLTSKNPAEHNRLNIRPTWSVGLDENQRIQRFDFITGDNICPEYIAEWDSFRKMCDNGVLGIKGSYTEKKDPANSVDLAKLRALEEENKKLKDELKKAEETNLKVTKIKEA